ncbi:MAG: hypothetical protein EOP53_05250 [Sphingobacteriales bacterium]|nr:MAG: hypothetical protein EOP53_05250 [Sphingobacteriales bacterium]
MNRFEKTHEELKRQLASIGIYDSDCPADMLHATRNTAQMVEDSRKERALKVECDKNKNTAVSSETN